MVKPWVRFGYADRKLSVSGKRDMQAAVLALVRQEQGIACRLQYVFCSDAYLHQMNLSFLQHDTYTDIITFDLSEQPTELIEGEIYISLDRVRANALALQVPFVQELMRVIFHGALHLCGYGDKTKQQKALMRAREAHYLTQMGLL